MLLNVLQRPGQLPFLPTTLMREARSPNVSRTDTENAHVVGVLGGTEKSPSVPLSLRLPKMVAALVQVCAQGGKSVLCSAVNLGSPKPGSLSPGHNSYSWSPGSVTLGLSFSKLDIEEAGVDVPRTFSARTRKPVGRVYISPVNVYSAWLLLSVQPRMKSCRFSFRRVGNRGSS